MVWDKGVYNNLQFVSTCSSGDGTLGIAGISHIGYYYSVGVYWLSTLIIEANIPPNFEVTSAFITIEHQPFEYAGYEPDTPESVDMTGKIGYARAVQIYTTATGFGDDMFHLEFGSEIIDDRELSGENTYALGRTGYTFSDTSAETKVSSDLGEYLEAGKTTVFKIGSTVSADAITGIVDMYQRTGRAVARLNVYGYVK